MYSGQPSDVSTMGTVIAILLYVRYVAWLINIIVVKRNKVIKLVFKGKCDILIK